MANSKEYSLEESIKELGKELNGVIEKITTDVKAQVATFALLTYQSIEYKAKNKFKNASKFYLENLNFKKIKSSESDDIYVISLGKGAGLLEVGYPKYSLLKALLNGPKAKHSKSGTTYNVIPFSHNKRSTGGTSFENKITKYVQKELKSRGLNKVITRDGKPVLGRVAQVDLVDKDAPRSRLGRPLLQGLTIYQSEAKNKKGEVIKDSAGQSKIKRHVLTFRTASSTQIGSGMWEHSEGGAFLFEETVKEMDLLWDVIINNTVKQVK